MKTLKTLHLFIFAVLAFVTLPVFAQNKGMSFQAVLKDPEGVQPTATGLSFTVQILDPVTNCVLREELHSGINITNGYVNLVIGGSSAATPANKNPNPILSLIEVMDNSKVVNGFGCAYTPSNSHARKLRLIGSMPHSLGGTIPIDATFNMRSVAYAINSETLNGKLESDFLNVNIAKGITQANAESLFERFTKLDGILSNSNSSGSGLSVNISGNAATATTATTVTGGINTLLPAQGTHAGKYLKTDGTSVSWETVSGGGGGLTQVGIDLPTSVFTNAADITANGKVTATLNTQAAKTFFSGPTTGTAVPTFRTLTTADVGSFSTDVATIADTQIAAKRNAASGVAGLDSSTKIPVSLLPNDAVFSSSVKAGVFKVAGPTTTEIQISAPGGLTSYDVVLPAAAGTAGQVLKINSVTNTGKTLNMAWDTVSGGGGGLASVGLSLPTDVFQVTGSPLAADGTISSSFKSQTQKQVFAAPNAADGAPAFRQLQVSDISNAKTAALYDVPVTGDAGTTQVVKGDDSRLTNTRTPADGSVTDAKVASGISASKISGNITGNAAGFTGNLAGDVTGAQGTTKVEKIQGHAVAATTPTSNQILKWDGSQWAPAADENTGTTYTAGSGLNLTGSAFSIPASGVTDSMLASGISASKVTGALSTGATYSVAMPAAIGTANQILKISSVTGSSAQLAWDTPAAPGGSGTLSSVGLSLPTDMFTVTGSPLTADGSISASLKSQTQSYVLAAPNGSAGAPTFRQLQLSDLSNAKSAALYDVPVTGDAGTTQVVKGDDSRLTNTRTPTDNTVTTAKIAASAVTDAKIDTMSASKLTGSIDSARLPAATGSADGIVTQIAQSFKGVKTFIDNVIMQGTLAVTGAISAASISTTGGGSFDYVKVANSSATCDGTTEGALRYNSTSKKMQFCNGTAWGNVSSGSIASLSIGNPSASIVKSGPVTFDVTYSSGTDSGTISLVSGNITIGGTATTGCSVSSVTGTGLTRTVTITGCSGTGTVGISVAAGTANSTTGDAASAAGPSATYSVDNTGPSAPTSVVLGTVPANTSTSPTISYTAGVDTGGSTTASNQVQITKNSDSSVILAWTTHTSGSSVSGLTLAFNTGYSVSVRSVDAVGNTGTASSLSSWTSSNTLWPAQYGSGWTLSGATATSAVGAHVDGTYAVGQVGPSSSFYFDVTIDSGSSNGKVGFIGVTTRDGTASMMYSNSGYAAWYYTGSTYRDGSQVQGSIDALNAGTYRVAVNFTNGKMYIQRTSGTPSTIYNLNLPTGYTTSNLRPFVMGQSTYAQITTTTLTGFTLGSGGLYP